MYYKEIADGIKCSKLEYIQYSGDLDVLVARKLICTPDEKYYQVPGRVGFGV
jgi:hypothetical protein